MATVTLIGKVKNPDGTIPTGSLEFSLTARTEDAGGNVNVPIPASVSIAGDGSVSASLEESQQYDVAAVLSGDLPARISLGRWTCPADGAITNPSLFDGWRNSLSTPKTAARLVANLTAALTKTPKRAAGDIWTFTGGASFGDYGLTIDGTKYCTIPGDGNLVAAAGSVIIAFKPTWAGNDGVSHALLDSYPVGSSYLRLYKDANSSMYLVIVDASAGVKTCSIDASGLPANTPAKFGCRWNGGALKVWLNAASSTTVSGAGTGILAGVSATLFLGSLSNGTLQLGGQVARLWIYERDLSDSETTAEMAVA